MADFAPPPGPPPPHVPEGWKAVWNTQYNEWFYVNVYTKQSQWEKPTQPVYPPGEAPPPGAPPNYVSPSAGGAVGGFPTGGSEKGSLGSNNPYANISEDEKLARKLQQEEEARARGASNDYYNQSSQSYPQQYGGYGQPSPNPYQQGQYQDTAVQDKGGKSKGFLGKILGKASGSSHSPSPGYAQQHHGYGQPSYGQPIGGGYYGGGGYGRPMGGGMMPMGGGGRRPGGGAGMGAMALGAGGGLLAGGLIGSAMAGDDGDTYVQNNYGDDMGGDDGGDMGDMGDMGGDF